MNVLTRSHGRAIPPWKPLRLSLQPRSTRNSPWLKLRSNQHDASKMTVVEKIIHDNIKATGPISFANYMKLCLSHPTHGYYTNHEHKVFGQQGDFITSPEISQTFGELIGLWFCTQYLSRTEPIRIIELGPGRGTLMVDILRVLSKFHNSHTFDVHLVETSHNMRALQKEKLSSHQNVRLHWHDSISELKPSSDKFTFIIAHEFFDALPVHVIQKTAKGWHDVLIAPTQTSPQASSTNEPNPISSHPPRLNRVLAPSPSNASTLVGHSSKRFRELPVGSTLEVSPDAFRIARKIGELLECRPELDSSSSSVGGCGLIVDYGRDKAFGDSLRAFKNHKIVDIFHQPGECDLTANVDFAYLKEAITDIVTVLGPISQHSFLTRMKIHERTKTLIDAADSKERQDRLQVATDRLVAPIGMGSQYQFLGIVSKNARDEQKLSYPF